MHRKSTIYNLKKKKKFEQIFFILRGTADLKKKKTGKGKWVFKKRYFVCDDSYNKKWMIGHSVLELFVYLFFDGSLTSHCQINTTVSLIHMRNQKSIGNTFWFSVFLFLKLWYNILWEFIFLPHCIYLFIYCVNLISYIFTVL